MVRKSIDQIGTYKLGRHRGDWVARWGARRSESTHKLGIAATEPEAVAKAIFAEWARIREGVLAKRDPLTVGEIVARYLDNLRIAGKPSAVRMGHNWTALAPLFANLKPADIEAPYDVRGELRTRCHLYALDRRTSGRARDTIHTELNVLRTAMAWAVKRGLLAKAPNVWLPKAGKKRHTQLTEAEVMALLDAAKPEPHIWLLLLVALYTGARKSAISELTWEQVDFGRATIDFRRDELGEAEDILDSSHIKGRAYVDMHPVLLIALAEAKDLARTNHVIEFHGKSVDNPKRGIRAAVERAGLSGRYIGAHALRHTLATVAADRGVDMRMIQKMLGHTDIRTTEQVYAKHTRGYTIAVANAVQIERRSPKDDS